MGMKAESGWPFHGVDEEGTARECPSVPQERVQGVWVCVVGGSQVCLHG